VTNGVVSRAGSSGKKRPSKKGITRAPGLLVSKRRLAGTKASYGGKRPEGRKSEEEETTIESRCDKPPFFGRPALPVRRQNRSHLPGKLHSGRGGAENRREGAGLQKRELDGRSKPIGIENDWSDICDLLRASLGRHQSTGSRSQRQRFISLRTTERTGVNSSKQKRKKIKKVPSRRVTTTDAKRRERLLPKDVKKRPQQKAPCTGRTAGRRWEFELKGRKSFEWRKGEQGLASQPRRQEGSRGGPGGGDGHRHLSKRRVVLTYSR